MLETVSSPRISVDAQAGRGQPRSESCEIDASVQQHLSRRYWDWQDVYAADLESTPLQHPDVVLAELPFLPGTGRTPVLVSQNNDTHCLGVGALLPKSVNSRKLGALPIGWQLHGYRLAGNQFLLREHDVAAESQMLLASLQHVTQQGGQFLLIEDLDEQTALGEALRTRLPAGWTAFRHTGIQPRRRIRLPAVPADYWQKFSAKTRQTFRRKLKKVGQTRLERITTIEDVPRFLEAAHQISKQTWQTRHFGLRVRNDVREQVQFVKLAELGLLRCYLWSIDGAPVAFTIGNQGHGCFHYEEVGYLPEYSRHSPGQLMLIQMIDDLIEHDPAECFDFGGGDADYKELFANAASESGTVWLFPPTVCGHLLASHLDVSLRVRQSARKFVTQLGGTTRFRQLVRYGWLGRRTQKSTAAPATDAETDSVTSA